MIARVLNLGFRKKTDCTIYVAKKGDDTADLRLFHMQKAGFLMTWLIYLQETFIKGRPNCNSENKINDFLNKRFEVKVVE